MGRQSFFIAALFMLGLMGPVPSAPGFERPDIAITPSSHDFGVVEAPLSSATLTVTIANKGIGDLTVREMSLAGEGHFTLDPGKGDGSCGSLTPVVPPGDSCTVFITFSPQDEGELTNSLVIRSDDLDKPEIRILLKGTGAVPEDGGSLTPGGPVMPGR